MLYCMRCCTGGGCHIPLEHMYLRLIVGSLRGSLGTPQQHFVSIWTQKASRRGCLMTNTGIFEKHYINVEPPRIFNTTSFFLESLHVVSSSKYKSCSPAMISYSIFESKPILESSHCSDSKMGLLSKIE